MINFVGRFAYILSAEFEPRSVFVLEDEGDEYKVSPIDPAYDGSGIVTMNVAKHGVFSCELAAREFAEAYQAEFVEHYQSAS